MGAFGAVTTLIILALNVIGALRLERTLGTGYEYALLAIVLMMIGGLIAILGIGINQRWGWSMALITYAGMLSYIVGMLVITGSSITLWLTAALGVFGYLTAMIGTEIYQPQMAPPAYTPPAQEKPPEKTKKKKAKKTRKTRSKKRPA